jgi:dipeptidyl aminopeptidase/acylaminoacyl peptidase
MSSTNLRPAPTAAVDDAALDQQVRSLLERKHLLDIVSPITHVGAQSVPTLVIHGTKDRVAPFAQAEALVKRLRACAIHHRFVPVAEGEHAFPFTPHDRNHNTDLMPTVTGFLNKHPRPHQP